LILLDNTAADILLENFRVSMSEVHILIINAKNNLPIFERSNAAADILLEHLRNI
jgi:hypothetical protein